MLPKGFDFKGFIRNYMQNITDPYLVNICKIEDDVENILTTLDNEWDKYDEEYINNIVDYICTSMIKICNNKLQNIADSPRYEILEELSFHYVDIAKKLMAEGLSGDEIKDIIYNKLDKMSDEKIEEIKNRPPHPYFKSFIRIMSFLAFLSIIIIFVLHYYKLI